MLFAYPMLSLMMDALNVIDMRLRLIAAGKSTSEEMFLMVNEKVNALEEARHSDARRRCRPRFGPLQKNSGSERRPFVGLVFNALSTFLFSGPFFGGYRSTPTIKLLFLFRLRLFCRAV